VFAKRDRKVPEFFEPLEALDAGTAHEVLLLGGNLETCLK
jgi:hypothetical protein